MRKLFSKMDVPVGPSVIQTPKAGARLKAGFDAMADLLAVTLGPTQGVVLSESMSNSRPELLNDAATIARRIIALPHRAEDVGAMLLRNLVWRMHTRTGDGSATTAVLAQAILKHAYRYTVAGGDPMSLRRGIDRATAAAVKALQEMAQPVEDEEDLVNVAQSVTGEPELSLVLGEMFDLLGSDAYINIEDYVAPYLEREYHEGGRWKGRLTSAYFMTDQASKRAILPGCHVVLYTAAVASIDDVRPLLELMSRTEKPRRVALLAHEVKSAALGALVVNHQKKNLQVIAAELRRPATQRQNDFEDLAVMTGAEILSPDRGRPMSSIKPSDLGVARRVEAAGDEVIVVGDPRYSAAVRDQIETLRARMEALPPDDEELDELRMRLARFTGSVATLKIGAATKVERAAMRQKAEKALRALPLALREGVVPGGGVAYLNCIPAVRQVEGSGDEARGVEILARALEEPFRRIVENAGVLGSGAAMDAAQRQGPDFGYDAMANEIVNMRAAGILDAAGVLREALQTAVSGAIMALTTETIVLRRKPDSSLEP